MKLKIRIHNLHLEFNFHELVACVFYIFKSYDNVTVITT